MGGEDVLADKMVVYWPPLLEFGLVIGIDEAKDGTGKAAADDAAGAMADDVFGDVKSLLGRAFVMAGANVLQSIVSLE